jgi:hypothetical protein
VVLVRPKPAPPDVSFDEATLLAYLKKRDCIRDFGEVENYCCCHNLNIDLHSFQKIMGVDKFGIYKTDTSVSKKVVFIKDPGWADAWAYYYDLEIPHHRHPKPIKKFRVTQN